MEFVDEGFEIKKDFTKNYKLKTQKGLSHVR